MLRLRKPQLIVVFTTFAILLILLSLPQIAPHRQRLLDYAIKSTTDTSNAGVWDDMKWGFQFDMPSYTLPKITAEDIAAAPHHWTGAGHETYATFYASRDAGMYDPYFLAAQQIVYRVLWAPESASKKHPMTVFVAPFISEEQRNYFRAAGAIVRELPIRDFVPLTSGSAGRLRDMFTKLEMWAQTEYSKITYLDSDAFPLQNVDEIFDLAIVQHCKKELLPPVDKPFADEICKYAFTGYHDFNGVNAGVMVFTPNLAMYNRLIRESLDRSQFDNGFMEQALLNKCFEEDGPFPPNYIDHAYNGGVDTKMQGKPLYIVHHKLWANGFDAPDVWYYNTFNETWREMLKFYKSDAFLSARHQDNLTSIHYTG